MWYVNVVLYLVYHLYKVFFDYVVVDPVLLDR